MPGIFSLLNIKIRNDLFSSVRSLDRFGRRGNMTEASVEVVFQSFSAGGHCKQFWHGQECPLFDAVHPAFPLPTMASPTLQGALKDGLERLSWRTCETCPNHAIPSLDSCQKRLLWTHEEADSCCAPVVGLARNMQVSVS